MTYLAVAAILALCGIVLLLGEYFFATGGLLIVAAVLCFMAALGIIGIYGSLQELVAGSVAVALGVPLLTFGAVYSWKRVFGGDPSPAAEASIAEMPEIAELDALRGRYGQALSPLRPSGVAEFDGRKIDVLTEGLMIDAGSWVKCVDVKPGKVIVRLVDRAEQPSTIPEPPPTTSPPESTRSSEEPKRKPVDLNRDDWTIN